MDSGSAERIILCILSMTRDVPGDVFLISSHEAFEEYMKERRKKEEEKLREQAEKDHLQVDEPVEFRILRTQRQFGGLLDISEQPAAWKDLDSNFGKWHSCVEI
jgi:hypothetical protein